MQSPTLSRRQLLAAGGATLATLALLNNRLAFAAPLRQGDEVLPWLDQPAENPVPQVIDNQQTWEDLGEWITPNDKFFGIGHYGFPEIDAATWSLVVDGAVNNPLSFTLADLQALPKRELTFTLECSGNSGLPFFHAYRHRSAELTPKPPTPSATSRLFPSPLQAYGPAPDWRLASYAALATARCAAAMSAPDQPDIAQAFALVTNSAPPALLTQDSQPASC